MAYYAEDATRQAVQAINGLGEPLRRDGVGAYYAYDATHEAVEPINGLALSGGAELADDAIRGVVGKRRPLMIAGEWAERASDISWKAAAPGAPELTLIPIVASELDRVRGLAFGHEAMRVGILMPELVSLRTVEAAFDGTPYALERLIAVYDVMAPSRGTPRFLAIGVLRDAADEDGGSRTMDGAARGLGGALVYPIALPAGRRPPLPPVSRVLAAERLPPDLGHGFLQKGVLGAVGPAELVAGAVGIVGVLALGYILSRSG
jgi:hypothetical protein